MFSISTMSFNLQFGLFCLFIVFGAGLFIFILWLLDRVSTSRKNKKPIKHEDTTDE